MSKGRKITKQTTAIEGYISVADLLNILWRTYKQTNLGNKREEGTYDVSGCKDEEATNSTWSCGEILMWFK